MSRPILAIANYDKAVATALLSVMTVFASAADPGIKDPLGFGGLLPAFTADGPTKSYSAKHYNKKLVYRAAKKRTVKRETIAKRVETAKTAQIQTKTEKDNSTFSAASLDKDVSKTTRHVGCKQFFPTIAKTLTVACVQSKGEPKITASIGCKRFFPAIGRSLTVPCE